MTHLLARLDARLTDGLVLVTALLALLGMVLMSLPKERRT